MLVKLTIFLGKNAGLSNQTSSNNIMIGSNSVLLVLFLVQMVKIFILNLVIKMYLVLEI